MIPAKRSSPPIRPPLRMWAEMAPARWTAAPTRSTTPLASPTMAPVRLAAAVALLAALAWLAPAHAADLRIEVLGARNADGHMAIALFAAPGTGFPGDEKLAVRLVRVPIDEASGRCATTLEGLPAGGYAAAVYHDHDDSGKLETGPFGMPRKPYGFSNDAAPAMRAARFEEARFELPEDGATITITLR